jgi:hypothetical protein
MNKAIVFLSVACSVGAAVACSSGDSGTGPTDSGSGGDVTMHEGGSSSGGSSSSSSSSSSGGGSDAAMCTGAMSATPVVMNVCCLYAGAISFPCNSGYICCGSASMATSCQPNSMACSTGIQLCAMDSDCVGSGMHCGSMPLNAMGMMLTLGICQAGDGGGGEGGGHDGGGDAGDSGSSSGGDAGDSGGGDTGSSDAPSEGG